MTPMAGMAKLLPASPASSPLAALALAAASLAAEPTTEVKLARSSPFSEVKEAISEAYSEVREAKAEVSVGLEARDSTRLEASARADWKSDAVVRAAASERRESTRSWPETKVTAGRRARR
jgi:hypothetical protein